MTTRASWMPSEIYLKQENYNVIKAYNGLEALQALEERDPSDSAGCDDA